MHRLDRHHVPVRVAGIVVVALMLCFATFIGVVAQAQQPPAQGGRGRITGAGIGAYPQRAPGDPAAVERGRALFASSCGSCHGTDIRGGAGGPSLLRSALVLDDRSGELIGPVVRQGRPERGMPAFSVSDAQIADLAAFMHSFRVNGYDASRNRPDTIVVGDARAGEQFFKARCASCHAPEGDLRGIANRITDARLLQQTWLLPGSASGRGGPPPSRPRPTRATVTLSNGSTVEGEVERIDDFFVALRLADGTRRSFRLDNGTPRVVVHDALQPHRDLLKTYADADIHNVTAYLVTLK